MTKSQYMDGAKCVCGLDTVSIEVKKPGPNRGRWFWRCPTRACNYFKWDSSASPFAQHPAQAYALAQPSGGFLQAFRGSFARFESNIPPPVTEKTKIRFTLATATTIVIDIVCNASETIMAVLDAIATSQDTGWVIPATYKSYQHALRALPTGSPNLNLEIQPMSLALSKTLEWLSLDDTAADIRETEIEERMLKARYYEALWTALKPFQKKGIREAVRRDGRVLLADETGLGKTMQAMGIMATFDDDWPVLIVCTKETQDSWVDHLMDWLLIERKDIHIIRDKRDVLGQKRKRSQKQPTRQKRHSIHASWAIGNSGDTHGGSSGDDDDDDNGANDGRSRRTSSLSPAWASANNEADGPTDLFSDHKIFIATFDHASRFTKEIKDRRFRFIVCDESQYLTKRTSTNNRNLVSILHDTDRLLMLWNNPDLSRPVELFSHLNALRKDMFPDFPRFGKNFCNGKQQVFGWNYSGLSNQVELKFILDELLWIRRTKEDVKDELPFLPLPNEP